MDLKSTWIGRAMSRTGQLLCFTGDTYTSQTQLPPTHHISTLSIPSANGSLSRSQSLHPTQQSTCINIMQHTTILYVPCVTCQAQKNRRGAGRRLEE